MRRIFSVRVNVDTIAASVGLLLTEAEKALWLQGFVYGLQGGAWRAGLPPAMESGWQVANESWRGAREHQAKSAEGGKKSIVKRPENSIDKQVGVDVPPKGTPDVPPNPPMEQSSNPIIHVSSDPKNDQSREVLDPVHAQAEDIMQADRNISAKVAAEPMKASWLDWRQSRRIGISRTGEDGDMDAWKSLWSYYGEEIMSAMYVRLEKKLLPGKKVWYAMAAEWLTANTKEV